MVNDIVLYNCAAADECVIFIYAFAQINVSVVFMRSARVRVYVSNSEQCVK